MAGLVLETNRPAVSLINTLNKNKEVVK